MKKQNTVLCVDDNDDNLELLKILFEMEGFEVTACSTAEDCLETVRKNDFSAIVLDYKLSDRDGLEVCRELRELKPHIPIVFYTGDIRGTSRQAVMEAGADKYLLKPDDLEILVPTVAGLIASEVAA